MGGGGLASGRIDVGGGMCGGRGNVVEEERDVCVEVGVVLHAYVGCYGGDCEGFEKVEMIVVVDDRDGGKERVLDERVNPSEEEDSSLAAGLIGVFPFEYADVGLDHVGVELKSDIIY